VACNVPYPVEDNALFYAVTNAGNHTVEKSAIQERLEVGVFTTVEDARRAVNGLLDAGFPKQKITVVCSDDTKERYFREFEHQEPAGTYTPTATIAGGTIGALLGGATVVASAVATGSLALWAAGPITAWAGGVAGGLVGAMMTRGVEKELANFYQQAVIEGQILVAAEADDAGSPSLSEAVRILAEAGAKPLTLPEG
jgi:outer membrane lipoprotein SlyB